MAGGEAGATSNRPYQLTTTATTIATAITLNKKSKWNRTQDKGLMLIGSFSASNSTEKRSRGTAQDPHKGVADWMGSRTGVKEHTEGPKDHVVPSQ